MGVQGVYYSVVSPQIHPLLSFVLLHPGLALAALSALSPRTAIIYVAYHLIPILGRRRYSFYIGFEKDRLNIDSFRGFIEKFSLFSNQSEVSTIISKSCIMIDSYYQKKYEMICFNHYARILGLFLSISLVSGLVQTFCI